MLWVEILTIYTHQLAHGNDNFFQIYSELKESPLFAMLKPCLEIEENYWKKRLFGKKDPRKVTINQNDIRVAWDHDNKLQTTDLKKKAFVLKMHQGWPKSF